MTAPYFAIPARKKTQRFRFSLSPVSGTKKESSPSGGGSFFVVGLDGLGMFVNDFLTRYTPARSQTAHAERHCSACFSIHAGGVRLAGVPGFCSIFPLFSYISFFFAFLPISSGRPVKNQGESAEK